MEMRWACTRRCTSQDELIPKPDFPKSGWQCSRLWLKAARRLCCHFRGFASRLSKSSRSAEKRVVAVEQHFQALACTPAEVLRHLGSPFAPDKDHDARLER